MILYARNPGCVVTSIRSYRHILTETLQSKIVTIFGRQALVRDVSIFILAMFFLGLNSHQAYGANFKISINVQSGVPINLIPKNFKPRQKKQLLSQLYGKLRLSSSARHAEPIIQAIERLWVVSGNENVDILMGNAINAEAEQDDLEALALLNRINKIAPNYAEAWFKKAQLHLRNESEKAKGLQALQRVLMIDKNHFRAIQTLARSLLKKGKKRSALKAYRQLLTICPQLESAKNAVRNLANEIEGQEA